MRGALTTAVAALALFLPAAASGGAVVGGHAPILGVVPNVRAAHALGAPIHAASATDLVLKTNPCTLSNSCWVMRSNTTYAIYWVPSGFQVSANYETLINRYFADVAAASGSASNVYSVATQYYDGTGPISYKSTFGGSYVDTNPFPASGCSDGVDSVCLTDAQLRTEIARVLSVKGWKPGTTKVFFLMTPSGVGSCTDATNASCSTNNYCAYHSGFLSGGRPVLYANEPYAATVVNSLGQHLCFNGTAPNGDDADATINTISHEHNETITDPWGTGWINSADKENGDLCAYNFGALLGGTVGSNAYNQVINGHPYYLQQEYSNVGSTCLQHYLAVPTAFASPAVSGAALQGKRVSTTPGIWFQAPTSYAYQWQRCARNLTGCVAIRGATSASYVLTAADAGHVVRSTVAAHNAAGSSAAATSAATKAVLGRPKPTRKPKISGKVRVGKRLSVSRGKWAWSPRSYRYQWMRCSKSGGKCKRISKASHARYRLTKKDAGHRLRVRVTAVNVAGAVSTTSSATKRVARARRR